MGQFFDELVAARRNGTAPGMAQMAPANSLARASVSSSGQPRARPSRKMAENASPAPTVSITKGGAGVSRGPRSSAL